jgi:hypothetical protein
MMDFIKYLFILFVINFVVILKYKIFLPSTNREMKIALIITNATVIIYILGKILFFGVK